MFSKMRTSELIALANDPVSHRTTQRNANLWAELFRRLPNNPNVALSYLFQLWNAEAVDLLRALLPSLVARFPNSVPVQALWIEYTVAWGDMSETRGAVESFLARFTQTSNSLLRVYQAYLALGDFVAARKIAETAASRPGGAYFEFFVNLAEQYEVRKTKWSRQSAPRDYNILCIGLDREPRRFARVRNQLQRMGENVHRISGVDGRTLPDMTSLALTHGASKGMKGTLGCFLSHIRALEICAESKAPYAFIIEDDAQFLLPPPPSVASLNLESEDFDICFVNDRTQNAAFHPQNLDLTKVVRLESLLPHRLDGFRGIGNDGYFVSQKGARKLLDMVAQDGLVGDVDWRMMLYAASDEEVDRTPNEFIAQTLKLHRSYRKSTGHIDAFVAPPAIVKTYSGGSVRSLMNEFEHAHEEIV